jgi:DNA-binding HxlR family transcriptional regulator
MKTYGQFCALAKALDVVGDRWSLLIVRELIIRGEARYTDIREGLPGIASNLLATRLKELEAAGMLEQFEAPPPVATTLYRLTPRGRELERVIDALAIWGIPFLQDAPGSDAFCSHWMTLPLRRALKDHAPGEASAVIEVRCGDEPVTVRAVDGTVRVSTGAAENPDAVVTGTAKVVYGLFRGELNLAQAKAAGLKVTGDTEVLRRVQPLTVSQAVSSRNRSRARSAS